VNIRYFLLKKEGLVDQTGTLIRLLVLILLIARFSVYQAGLHWHNLLHHQSIITKQTEE